MKKTEQVFLFGFFFIYVVLGLTLLYYHEPWRDEAQAWLIARDLSFLRILSQMGYEGTPAFWHVLIMPFAKLGFPYKSMHVLHFFIAIVIIYFWLYKSPFPLYIKLLYIFSYSMLFDYCVIARNYNISLLLLFVIAYLYKERKRFALRYAVLIALLSNTNAHSFGIALVLTFIFYRDVIHLNISVSRRFALLLIPLLGIITAFYQLLPHPDNIYHGLFQYHKLNAPFYALINGFTSLVFDAFFFDGVILILVLYAIVQFLKVSKEKNCDVYYILIFSYGWLFYIFICKHFGFFRHHVFLLNVFIFCLWIYKNDQVKTDRDLSAVFIPLTICLIVSVVHCGIIFQKEIKLPFSGSTDMASYIKQNGLEKEIIVAYRAPHASSVLPYFNNLKFWYADIRDYGTFITWNTEYERNQDLKTEDIFKRAEDAGLSRAIFLFNKRLPNVLCKKYKLVLVYKVDNVFGYGEETLFLYKKMACEKSYQYQLSS